MCPSSDFCREEAQKAQVAELLAPASTEAPEATACSEPLRILRLLAAAQAALVRIRGVTP